jgi:hypothetical protein
VLGPLHPATLTTRRMITEAVDLIGEPVQALLLLDELIRDLVLTTGGKHLAALHAQTVRLEIQADCGDVSLDDIRRLRDDVIEVAASDHPLVARLDDLSHRVFRGLFGGDGP